MEFDSELYPGGFFSLMKRLEKREHPFLRPEQSLPKADVEFAALWRQTIPEDIADPDVTTQYDPEHKLQQLRYEMRGQSEIFALHAFLIAILRRRPTSELARQLFLRLWSEDGARLAKELAPRWLISAATTFADHGATTDQRLGGQGLALLFDLIKLHDSERRLSGRLNSSGFPRIKGRSKDDLAFDLEGYSLRRGDMDKNILARLWRHGENDQVIAPLCQRMLGDLVREPRTVFARIQRYKNRRAS
jgi:hypothetical protein